MRAEKDGIYCFSRLTLLIVLGSRIQKLMGFSKAGLSLDENESMLKEFDKDIIQSRWSTALDDFKNKPCCPLDD